MNKEKNIDVLIPVAATHTCTLRVYAAASQLTHEP